jgi:hypothetical protein
MRLSERCVGEVIVGWCPPAWASERVGLGSWIIDSLIIHLTKKGVPGYANTAPYPDGWKVLAMNHPIGRPSGYVQPLRDLLNRSDQRQIIHC